MDRQVRLKQVDFSSEATPTDSRLEGNGNSLRGAFGYAGSKQRLARRILHYQPPHTCWVELFGGSLALTMAKEPAEIEIVNDLDEEIVNVFRQLRSNGEALIRLIELTPYARSELEQARRPCSQDTDLERARKFLVQAMMSVNGVIAGHRGGFSISDTYARQSREARVNRWINYPDRLEAVVNRLRNVRVENRDGIDLLAEYSNKPATLVYIDPPYLADRCRAYKTDAVDQHFHARLLSQALLCKCMVIISGYASSTYTQLLEQRGGWHRIEMGAVTQSTNGVRRKRTELLWMNGAATEALGSNNIGILLSQKERKEGRVNPPRGAKRTAKRIWRVT